MKTIRILALTTFATMMFLASEADAAKRPGAQPLPCLQQSVAYEKDPEAGILIVRVELRNGCLPSVDMQGTAQLAVDGVIADFQPLGIDDKVVLVAKLALDGADHQACVHFEGTQTQFSRKGSATAPLSHDQCAAFIAR